MTYTETKSGGEEMGIPVFARFQLARGPVIGIILGLLIGAVGYFLGFVASPGAAQDQALLDTALVPDKTAIESLAAGSEVAIQGTLDGNTELNTDALVAYTVERLVERPARSDSGKRHRWEFVASEFALLKLQIDGGAILISAPGPIVNITGNAHEVIDTSTELAGTARTFLYNGQNLGTGARRIRGVRNGDIVSVIGTRTGSGDVQLRRVHAGDVDSFRASLAGESASTAIFGYAGLGLGVLLIITSSVALFRRRTVSS